MGEKPFYRSKTIVANVLVLVIAAFTALQNHELIASNPRVTAWVLAGVGFMNAVLRLVTFEPIKMGD